MDRMMGRAVRVETGVRGASRGTAGRRAQQLVLVNRTERGTVVRAVASAATLALLALTIVSSLGGAQATRRDPSNRARTPLIGRAVGDTIADRRVEPDDSAFVIDASRIASSVRAMADSVARTTPLTPVYRSRSDSIASVRTRAAADKESGLRIVISLNERRLWALIGSDTLLKTAVAVSTDEEVIFDSTLFVPPVGTLNRRIEGELGRHTLDTGNGFLLHGTPHKASIGTAATHGCIRLRDEDIEWLYDMIPVGTRVYIY